MEVDTAKSIAAYIAIATPATVAIAGLARLALEWLKAHHAIKQARTQQSHEIVAHYLGKALDPQVPLAIRHQLLRFLATPDDAGGRLHAWAESELRRVGGIVDETNRAVSAAEAALQEAKTAADVAAAERRLGEAVRKQRSLLEAPAAPPVNAAALRAGLVTEKSLLGLKMPGADLTGASLVYRELRGADFSNATLTDVSFQGSDLRAADFTGAKLERTRFYMADVRGADFSLAEISTASFLQARLEGASLKTARIAASDLRATYDDDTSWPDGLDVVPLGAVHVSPAEPNDNGAV